QSCAPGLRRKLDARRLMTKSQRVQYITRDSAVNESPNSGERKIGNIWHRLAHVTTIFSIQKRLWRRRFSKYRLHQSFQVAHRKNMALQSIAVVRTFLRDEQRHMIHPYESMVTN